MSVHWPIIRRCLAAPGAVAAIDDRRTWRRAEILGGALHLADALSQRLAPETTTVGVLLPTSAAFGVASLASWILGRTVVPLNYLLKPGELQYVVDDCGCDTVVTVQPMLDFLPEPPRVRSMLRLEDVRFRGIPEPRLPSLAGCANGGRDDLAVLLYTSGTSGRPKGVMLTHHNLSSNVAQCVEWVQFDESDTLLGVLPQFHSFGLTVLTVLPLIRGCRVVYSAKFLPAQIYRLMRQHRPTAFIAIPSMYAALLSVKSSGPDDWESVKYIVSGGEPLPRDIAQRFHERYGRHICEGYGLTETSPVTNWCRPSEYAPGVVGMPLPRVEERIVEPSTGRLLAQGQEGEVRIRGPMLMKGYYRLPKESAEAFDEDGYLRTGDMGRFDEKGRLAITGRIKDMLIIGGENVFPREIEEALESHPAVGGAGVVGKPDDLRGELPVAFVEFLPEADRHEGCETPTGPALRAWCRDRVAGYKVPDEVVIVESLPRGPTGKVLRRVLRERLRSGEG